MKDRLTSTSKFLSLILRHRPEKIGLVLDDAGWASIDELINKANVQGRGLTEGLLREVVETNAKQRFSISSDAKMIRANQGHSVQVDLGLKPMVPPDVLYHGTVSRFVESIQQQGLMPGERHHVHLSIDKDTAVAVGARRGKPLVIEIDAKQMVADGVVFYVSDNGVWLVDRVDPTYCISGLE